MFSNKKGSKRRLEGIKTPLKRQFVEHRYVHILFIIFLFWIFLNFKILFLDVKESAPAKEKRSSGCVWQLEFVVPTQAEKKKVPEKKDASFTSATVY